MISFPGNVTNIDDPASLDQQRVSTQAQSHQHTSMTHSVDKEGNAEAAKEIANDPQQCLTPDVSNNYGAGGNYSELLNRYRLEQTIKHLHGFQDPRTLASSGIPLSSSEDTQAQEQQPS